MVEKGLIVRDAGGRLDLTDCRRAALRRTLPDHLRCPNAAAPRASVIWLTLWLGLAAYDARTFWANPGSTSTEDAPMKRRLRLEACEPAKTQVGKGLLQKRVRFRQHRLQVLITSRKPLTARRMTSQFAT